MIGDGAASITNALVLVAWAFVSAVIAVKTFRYE